MTAGPTTLHPEKRMNAPTTHSSPVSSAAHAVREHRRSPAIAARDAGHPLGAIFTRYIASPPARGIGLLLVGGVLAVFVVARSIVPDPAGFGSHQQLGLAPCMMPAAIGLPCPTCGMTTAFAHAARLDFPAAFLAQPVGLLLAVLTAVAGLAGLDLLVTGRYWMVNWYRVSPAKLVVAGTVLLCISWLGKIAVGVLNGSYPLGR